MGAIYCYTNKINNKKYIGQSINPESRFANHKSSYQNEQSNEYNSLLHQAFRKYGYDNFEYEILVNNVDDIDILNALEIYYISFYNTIVPNGYNIEPGGKNCSRPKSDEQKYKEIWGQAKLTEEEVIELRIAYKDHKSPTEIYNLKYKNRLHYNSFLNIWVGKRYGMIMPEVFEAGRHTKANEEIVKAIRKDREETNLSFDKLAKKYNLSKGTIADIIHRRTWKNV